MNNQPSMTPQGAPKQIQNPKKGNKKKTISNIIFLVAMTILVLTLVFSLGELEQIGNTIKAIGQGNNFVWLIVAFILTLVYFILWPISTCLFAKASKCKSSFFDSFLIGSSEHFYNGITPFSVGGQPFQIYSYTKRGVSSDKATGVILANFVTFMISTNVLAFISLFFWKDFTDNLSLIGNDLQWFKGVAIAGFVVNFVVLLFMIALGTSKTVRKVIYWLFDLICKPKWLGKHLSKYKHVLDDYIGNAQTAFKSIVSHKTTFVWAFLIRLITMIIFYTIPFFIMKAVGLPIAWNQLYLVIFGTAFAITSVVFVPTPGGTGGVEFAFSIVIAAILGSSGLSEASAVSLMWRLFTYYFLMLLSFIFSAILEGRISKGLSIKEKVEAICAASDIYEAPIDESENITEPTENKDEGENISNE